MRLGVYEITAQIGEGGMGQVFRARDTKLNRDVALKVLPESFASDAERLARLTREAQTLALLNHPHIAAIYGLEESGGVRALVMELVEGEDLSQRIARGPIPIDEALPIAKQIAEALEAAHEHGVIHRDLKPANIKVREDGVVKVLDFGLAKAIGPNASSPHVSQSPTITTPAMTLAGAILGTGAYMSPEQAKGLAADRRSDVWAFGCVLYEMLTGQRAFDGEDLTDTIAAVMRAEPEWTALPAGVPPAVRTLIRRCLEKDRQRRIAEVSVLLFVLSEPTIHAPTSGSTSTVTVVPRSAGWRRIAIPAGAALAAAAVAGAAVWLATHTTVAPSRVSRLLITPPTAAALTVSALGALGATRDIAITPDGTRVVYRGANGTTLFVRALDQLDATPLTGLGLPNNPFVSPDGQWIGFADGRDLKRVAITGGPAETLARLDAEFRGATWAPDGTIVFATANAATGLQQMPANDGEPSVLTRPDRPRGEADHFWPEFLPGGQAILFTITATTGGLDQAQVAVLDLRTGEHTTLIPGASDAHYVPSGGPRAGTPSGHLVYGAAGSLRAIAFDLSRLATVGTSVPVVTQVVTTTNGAVNVAAAGDGTLVYVPGVGTREPRTLVFVDRLGKEMIIATPPRTWDQPRIAPDGTQVALHSVDEGGVWLWNLARGGLTRPTSDPSDIYPVWIDSRRLLFASSQTGAQNLFTQAADGTGAATQLTQSPNTQRPTSVSPDGTRLVFYENNPTTGWDVMQLRLDGTHEITPLVQTPKAERNPEISPDGRWLAYEADDSGQYEIYVRPFPDVNRGRSQVSTAGGAQALWAPGSEELFYFAPSGALMGVRVVGRGAAWAATMPAKLLEARYYTGTTAQVARMYGIARDGRFLMIKEGGGSESSTTSSVPTSLVVVQHFDEELKRLVPTN